MKRIFKISLITSAVFAFGACSNFNREFEDYEYTSGYFPYQYPVRTLILGDDWTDNSNDNAHKFVISAAMGGVYENTKERAFSVTVDESLCRNLLFTSGGDEVKPLPSSYYNLSSSDRIVIAKGEYNGGVEVQLTDAFFNDPLAIKNTYVVPMRITGSSDVDTILLSKNFTLFAIKYINEYHGNYLLFGSSSVKDPSGATVETTTYKPKYVENSMNTKLTTTARNQVSASINFQSNIFSGVLSLLFTFSGNSCTVSAPAGVDYTVSGSGEFKQFKIGEYEAWSNKDRNGIVVNYTVTNSNGSYTANETFVIRDRAVVMEVFSPVEK